MSDDPAAPLRAHQPTHEFLVCIDSDGCAFDSMEIKHKECFIPMMIKHWGLQPISKYARMAFEFVNLYSQSRGVNRFPALVETFDLLREWDVVAARNVSIDPIPNLKAWVKAESKLGNPALKAYVAAHPDQEDMAKTLAWSVAVNDFIADLVKNVPPFPLVRESLQRITERADAFVCSGTPQHTLQEEWDEHQISQYVFTIAGQEQGKKAEHIALAGKGKYDPAKILMIGDAPGDQKAAKANGALFFPICPGSEEASWERLYSEGLDRFFAGTFAGAYEDGLIAEFNAILPSTPPWAK